MRKTFDKPHAVGARTFDELWKAKGAGLYVSRKLLNAADLVAWVEAAGVPNLVPAGQMHVTNVYSRKAIVLPPKMDEVVVQGGKRSIESLGDKGAVVLKFESSALSSRWQEAADVGATWDYETSYHPHVTLSYDAGGKDLSALVLPRFALRFGPEVHEPIDDDWAENNGLRVAKAFGELYTDATLADIYVSAFVGGKKPRTFYG